jgi:hypothetical protein
VTSFWIFIAIVVIQAVVGGIAKSAEKRKKREAAQKLAEQRASRPSTVTPAPATAKPEEVEVPVVARRIAEMLGATIEAGTGVSVGTTSSSSSTTKPPPAIDDAVRLARQRRVEALRQRQARAAGSPPPPPPSAAPRTTPPPAATSSRPSSVTPRPDRTPTPKSEAPKGAATSVARPARAAAIAPPRRSTSTTRVTGMLRNPRSVRDAILVAELLREPVALRRSAPGGGF